MTEPIREKVSPDDQPHRFDPEQMPSGIEPSPSSQAGPNMGRSLGQILIILVVLLVLVNIPFNSYSAGLAQLMPQSNSIVIREGLLFKGSGPEIYIVDNYKLRQISPEAMKEFFSHYGRINTVEDSLLAQFGQGPPVYRLLQCLTKPDIYVVEDGYKRQVTEPPLNAVHPWDKVHFVSCNYLAGLPDGPPIYDFGER